MNYCEKPKKRNRPGEYQKINDILYLRYQKCCASNIYPNSSMLKEEASKWLYTERRGSGDQRQSSGY